MKPIMIALVGCLALGAAVSQACTCMEPPAPKMALAGANAVFAGKVLEVKEILDSENLVLQKRVHFEIMKKWKGMAWLTEVALLTRPHEAACGYPFTSGTEYLVYGHLNSDGQLTTSICTRTQPLSEAGSDLAELGPGETR